MIKREHLKLAIDAIARQAPEIGYALEALLHAGAIDAPGTGDPPPPPGGLYFWFRKEPVVVHRTGFFTEGVDILVQPLLVRYGEMAGLQARNGTSALVDLGRAAEAIRVIGLDTAVRFEIDGVLARLHRRAAKATHPETGQFIRDRIDRLAPVQSAPPARCIEALDPGLAGGAGDGFQGVLADGRPAFFIPFPFSHAALVQAADLDLEFFHLRFLLRCLEKGHEDRLFGCLAGGRIEGLVYLDPQRRRASPRLEIVYIASRRGAGDRTARDAPPGIGTFLVAGTWLLWQVRYPGARELFLDAEVAARPFYDAVGFRPRRICGYVLERPGDRLLAAIVTMADLSPVLAPAVVAKVADQVRRRLADLGRRRSPAPADRQRLLALARSCVLVQHRPAIARTAVEVLLSRGKQIPESEGLIRLATTGGRVRFRDSPLPEPVAVVHDLRFCRHLEGIFHMEGARRIQAVEAALHHPSLAGKWFNVEPRPATEEELCRVHTQAHVAAVARTACGPITSLDPDTQATAHSFETARLAAGSVIDLLDRVWRGENPRGMAFVRPPGHHAEPQKAMGFCLFNNIALGACHLMDCHGARRILIVDIDAHHGNGTQTVFYDDDRVLFVSLHRFPGYPGTGSLSETGGGQGTGFNVNVPLPGGLGDADLVQVIQHMVLPLSRAWHPEIILVSCGFDLHRYDRLGGMKGSSRGYAQMTTLLVQAAQAFCGGRIAFVLEGGYNVLAMETCTRSVMQVLCGKAPPPADRSTRSRPTLGPLIKALAVQKKYWPGLR
ncbi:MAG: histone deacetylase [Desulfobacterales bacterium]|nr:histone deacetylase [Desulfobacterales bacterium]